MGKTKLEKKLQEEAMVNEAEQAAVDWQLDQDIAEAEQHAYQQVIADKTRGDILERERLADQAQAGARAAFLASFAFKDRHAAVWYVRRLLEAKERLQKGKNAHQAQIRRLERALEFAEGLKPQLMAWALEQERDTPASIRMPEAGARLQFRELKEGFEITSDEQLVISLLDSLGVMGALDEKLLRTRYDLDKTRFKEWASEALVVSEGALAIKATGEVLNGIRAKPAGKTLIVVRTT